MPEPIPSHLSKVAVLCSLVFRPLFRLDSNIADLSLDISLDRNSEGKRACRDVDRYSPDRNDDEVQWTLFSWIPLHPFYILTLVGADNTFFKEWHLANQRTPLTIFSIFSPKIAAVGRCWRQHHVLHLQRVGYLMQCWPTWIAFLEGEREVSPSQLPPPLACVYCRDDPYGRQSPRVTVTHRF
jgi:hypothetical protein